VDVTKGTAVDDNAFEAEIARIVDNSFNIHPEGERFVFRDEENYQTRLKASARNDKLFQDGADRQKLAQEIRYVIGGGTDVPRRFHVIVLPRDWRNDPWSELEESMNPSRWDERFALVILPENPVRLKKELGKWLKEHVAQRRNTVRFLVPREGSGNVYEDRELIVLARAVHLAEQWKENSSEYRKWQNKYERDLRNAIKVRFDRFAIIQTWNYAEPARCEFHVLPHKEEGEKIPEAIDSYIREHLFIPEDFKHLVLAAAEKNDTVRKLMQDLQEPRPNEEECIPWIGETAVKEKLVRLCARGSIAINLRGMRYLQCEEGEEEETAWRRMRGNLGTGKHLEETHILLPEAVPTTGGVAPGSEAKVDGKEVVEEGSETNGEEETTSGGDIFGGTKAARLSLSSSATSALNLLGQMEKWGITPGTGIEELTLGVDKLTGAQLDRLLRSLPDGVRYALDLKKEES